MLFFTSRLFDTKILIWVIDHNIYNDPEDKPVVQPNIKPRTSFDGIEEFDYRSPQKFGPHDPAPRMSFVVHQILDLSQIFSSDPFW